MAQNLAPATYVQLFFQLHLICSKFLNLVVVLEQPTAHLLQYKAKGQEIAILEIVKRLDGLDVQRCDIFARNDCINPGE